MGTLFPRRWVILIDIFYPKSLTSDEQLNCHCKNERFFYVLVCSPQQAFRCMFVTVFQMMQKSKTVSVACVII